MQILFLIIGLGLGFAIGFLLKKKEAVTLADTSQFDKKISELETERKVWEEKHRQSQSHFDDIKTSHEKQRQELLEHHKKEREKTSDDFKAEKERLLSDIKAEQEKHLEASKSLEKSRAFFKAQEEKINEQKSEIENLQKKLVSEFENIANKILDEKSQKFTEQNKTNLDTILNPLKERIKDFETKVDTAYKTESAERTTLKAEIKQLVELNKQVSDEANNLTKALKGDNKAQGNWGEVILEKILERSGLNKERGEYTTQQSHKNAHGETIKPDAIIYLPDNKHIIIDSKVSLVAYQNFIAADIEEDKQRSLKEHIASIKNHIKGLSDKHYATAENLNTPDFVLLFVPIESSFGIAVQSDQELFSFAWDRKIVVVSPSTLLATLRTISAIWKQELQTKNAIEIAKASGALYDKFVAFVEDMQRIDRGIEQTRKSYDEAFNKLKEGKGNLISRAHNIEKLGAKTSKSLPDNLTDKETQLFVD